MEMENVTISILGQNRQKVFNLLGQRLDTFLKKLGNLSVKSSETFLTECFLKANALATSAGVFRTTGNKMRSLKISGTA
jgi:hypothetical protein